METTTQTKTAVNYVNNIIRYTNKTSLHLFKKTEGDTYSYYKFMIMDTATPGIKVLVKLIFNDTLELQETKLLLYFANSYIDLNKVYDVDKLTDIKFACFNNKSYNNCNPSKLIKFESIRTPKRVKQMVEQLKEYVKTQTFNFNSNVEATACLNKINTEFKFVVEVK